MTTSLAGPAAPSRRRLVRLLPVACLAFVALGLRDASLGVAWPSVRATFDQPLAALGWLLAAGMAGYLTTSLASGWLAGVLGYRRLLVGASAVGVVGLVVVTCTPVWAGLVAGMLVLGLSAGVVDAGLNTAVAFRHGVRGLGFLHAAYGAGAVGGPLLMAVVVAGPGSWRLGYGLLVAVYAAVTVALLAADLGGPPAPVAAGDVVATAVPPHRRLSLAVAVVLFFVYVGVEATAGQWAFSLLTEVRSVGDLAAGVWVGAFWGGFTLGRLATGVAGHRVAPAHLVDASIGLCAAGAALFWWNPVDAAGGIGLVVLGVGLAAVFPTLVAVTPQRVGERHAPRAIGYQVAAAALGAAALPAVFGVLAGDAGLELLGPVLLAGTGVMAVLHRAAVVLERRGEASPGVSR